MGVGIIMDGFIIYLVFCYFFIALVCYGLVRGRNDHCPPSPLDAYYAVFWIIPLIWVMGKITLLFINGLIRVLLLLFFVDYEKTKLYTSIINKINLNG